MSQPLPPRSALVLAALLPLAGPACAPAPRAPARSLVLITLDTTRADRIGCFGGASSATPEIDALAAESVVYLRARTVAPLTLPAHASMWTGLYPPRHGLRDNGLARLPESATTLAELAGDAGIETAAFVAAAVLGPAFGLDQGFETYDAPPTSDRAPGPDEHMVERPAAAVVDAVEAWWRGRDRARPFLLWVHLFDPHAPYAPDPGALARAGGDPYLGEIAATDAAVGRLLDLLRADGALDEALVVLVADHGESLGEGGEPTHGILCDEATIRVPMLVRHPGGHRAGERSDEVVSVADVFPTAADALGLGWDRDIDGRSLLGGRVAPDRGVYFESYYGHLNHGWSPLVGWADARGEYQHSSTPELRGPDGRERALEGGGAAPYLAAIEALLAKPSLVPDPAEVGDDALRAVRQLGYAARSVGAGPPAVSPLARTTAPSPREGLAALRELFASVEAAGSLEERVERLEAILERAPADRVAAAYLASYLVELDRHAEARPYLERLVATGPVAVDVHANLAACLEAAGEPTRAAEHLRRVLELDPRDARAARALARILRSLGEPGEAARIEARLEGARRGRDD